MNILILGGNGFAGSHLADALLLEGHKVRVLDKSHEKYRVPLANVDYRIGDFTDELFLAESLKNIDLVFHALSTTVPGTSNLNPKADAQINLVGTIGLLDQMVKVGVKRIVFFSSGGTVYGNADTESIPETHFLNPIGSSYAITKAAIENYLFLYEKLHGFKPLVLRISNLYGPRYGHIGIQGIITTFLSAILKNEPLQVWGDGSAVRDYLYVDDLIRLCVLAAKSNETGVFNVGAGRGYSILEIIDAVARVVGRKSEVKFEKSKALDIKRVVLDISKAKKVFNWEPRVSLEEGINNVWKWMSARV
ncbi:MAG: NAD-dependent epimerase/dehydratase family protein [Patescibacteria group bacterium]